MNTRPHPEMEESQLVCLAGAPDRTFFSVFSNGNLEIRGKGWETRRPKDPPGADRPRICKLATPERAKAIAERVAHMVCDLPADQALQWV